MDIINYHSILAIVIIIANFGEITQAKCSCNHKCQKRQAVNNGRILPPLCHGDFLCWKEHANCQ